MGEDVGTKSKAVSFTFNPNASGLERLAIDPLVAEPTDINLQSGNLPQWERVEALEGRLVASYPSPITTKLADWYVAATSCLVRYSSNFRQRWSKALQTAHFR